MPKRKATNNDDDILKKIQNISIHESDDELSHLESPFTFEFDGFPHGNEFGLQLTGNRQLQSSKAYIKPKKSAKYFSDKDKRSKGTLYKVRSKGNSY